MTSFIPITLAVYFLLVLLRPHWGIYFILALLPAYQIRFSVFGLPSTFLEWLILLLAAGLIIKLSFGSLRQESRDFLRRLKKLNWLPYFVVLFFLASLVAVWVSPVTIKALGVFKAYVFEGILFWLMFLFLIDTPAKFYRSLQALGLLVSALALFGIVQYFTLYRLPPSWWGPGIEPRRVVSLYTYPNAVSLLITPLLALFSGMLVFYKKLLPPISKTFLVVVMGLGLILLLLTFSRGAWAAYICAMLFLGLFSPYKKYLITAVAAGLVLLLLIPATRHRLLPAITGTDPAGHERIKLLQSAWEIIKAQPIMGAGLMGFREWYGGLRQSGADEILNYPHNFFLNFWIETGLLGLLAVLAMLGWMIKKGIELIRRLPETREIILCFFAALLALLAHGMVDAPFFKNDLAILFWFLLALVPVWYLMRGEQELR